MPRDGRAPHVGAVGGLRGMLRASAVIVWLLAVFTALAAPAPEQPTYFVRGSSMAPTLREGDLLRVASRVEAPWASLEVGDIIAFSVNGRGIVHRVHYVPSDRSFVLTKGDANPGHDPFHVRPEHYVGKVVGVVSTGVLGYPFTTSVLAAAPFLVAGLELRGLRRDAGRTAERD